MTRLNAARSRDASKLKKMCWNLLKKRSRVLGRARQRLNTLIFSKLATARAWILKDAFPHFWTYRALEVALYQNLGKLPEPPFTHKFC